MKRKYTQNTQTSEYTDLLKDFGLSENEAAVYIGSLKLGNALVKDIAKNARLNRTTAYNILLGLRKLGLVASYQKGGLTYFSASPPGALGDLANQRISIQEKLKTHLHELLPALNALFHSQGRGSGVKIYEGLGSLGEIYRSIYKNVHYPVEGLEFTNWGGKYDLFPAIVRQNLLNMFARQRLHIRSLLVEDKLTKGWHNADRGASQSKTIRLVPNPGWSFFCNLELCENRIAIVTYKDEADFQGLVVENTELASMLRFMFDALWQQLDK